MPLAAPTPPPEAAGPLPRPSARPVAPADLAGLVDVLRLLADPTRLRILLLLSTAGELCVGRICEELGLAQPTASHHLALMRQARLLANRREGKSIHYGLHPRVMLRPSPDGHGPTTLHVDIPGCPVLCLGGGGETVTG